MNAAKLHLWEVTIGSDDGLVPQATSHYLSRCWPRFLLLYGITTPQWVNWLWTSLAHTYHEMPSISNPLPTVRYGSNFKSVVFKHMFRIKFVSTSSEIALRWIPENTFEGKSTMGQVMAWCSHASSHYLRQCWPRSMSPYGVTRPKWIYFSGQVLHMYIVN